MTNRSSRLITLPDGTIIRLPSFDTPTNTPSPFSTMNTREEFETSCYGQNGTGGPEDGNDYVYPQADWCYSKDYDAYPQNFFVFYNSSDIYSDNIFIDGTPSTNPLRCGDEDVSLGTFENCSFNFTDVTGIQSSGIPFWPNYAMNDWNDPTGNADAIAVMFRGTIVGFDFINNIGTTNFGSIPGIMIPIQHTQGQLTLPDYPNVGDYIDDLILYKASTGTYHYLTDESYDRVFNSGILQPLTAGQQISTLDDGGSLHFESEETTILPGDTNVDGDINVLDIVTIVNWILTEIPGEEIAQLYPQADMNGDGAVNVLDVVTLAQLILNNPTTSSRDRKELQRQLTRLGQSR